MEVVFTESDFNVRGRYEQRALEILQERPSRPYLVEGLESRIPKGLNNAPPSHEELRKFISDHHLTDEEYTTFEMPELRELKRLLQDILKLQKVWYDFKAEQREKEAQTDGVGNERAIPIPMRPSPSNAPGNPNRPNHMTSPNYFPSPTFDVPRTPWMRVQPPYHTPYTPPRPAFQSSGQRRNTPASTSPHSGTRGTPPSANISQNSQSPYGRDNGFFSPSDPLETSPPRQTGIYSSPNQPHRYSPPRQPGMYSPPRQAGMYSPPRQTGMYSPNSSPGERHYQQNNSLLSMRIWIITTTFTSTILVTPVLRRNTDIFKHFEAISQPTLTMTKAKASSFNDIPPYFLRTTTIECQQGIRRLFQSYRF
ncbi:hypothetical protein BT69DRAFT_41480 [Atractiella rhizophila]|nr:hypothetical protein BT69DRAFT_41480 [Atractiella rhizophila]